MRLSLAIPDSALSDESTKINKSRKVSSIGRSASIFGIHTIFVYRDGKNPEDRSLLVTILRYMETPQFLRRRLFPRIDELKFAGILQPLGIPSHQTDTSKIKDGDIREGLAVTVRGKQYVDVGLKQLVRLHGDRRSGRTTVRFRMNQQNMEAVPIDNTTTYWGYAVKERSDIRHLLREWSGGIIVTTRQGKMAIPSRTARHLAAQSDTLIVFGSPQREVREISGGTIAGRDVSLLNFFPHQNTRTIRLEEAILGTLSILNMQEHMSQ